MICKFFLIILILFLVIPCYAHPGRLDGSGGHRVNKPYEYKGVYFIIKNKEKTLKTGGIYFEEGDYHYHVHPMNNGYKDGVYLPVENMNETVTDKIYISDENRVASRYSNRYHTPDCRYIRRIKEENIIIFEDPEDAERNGYIPCKKCKPEEVEL